MKRNETERNLNLFDELMSDPSKLLTMNLDAKTMNFLFKMEADNNKTLKDAIVAYFSSIPCFNGLLVKNNSCGIIIAAPPLRYGPEGESDTCDYCYFMYISFLSKTYSFYENRVNLYERMIGQNPELRKYELSDFYKQFEDTSFKNRMHLIDKTIHNKNMKPGVKIANTFFWLTYPVSKNKQKMELALAEEKERIEKLNKEAEESYEKEYEKYVFIKQNMHQYIELIRSKFDEIVAYLKETNPEITSD